MHRLAQLDHRHLWHPFTQMRGWLNHEPLVIVRGHGAVLQDAQGHKYLDANSSIWTNLHGHNHPKINAAIKRQLDRIAHSSALGLANEPAALLGEQLVTAANAISSRGQTLPAPTYGSRPTRRESLGTKSQPPNHQLNKVFFSDDGSTAMEVALKLAYEFARRTGHSKRPRFLSLQGAYHGDTVGAVALGHIDLFHKAYSGLLFKTESVMAPYCYRCPFNRAKPERADAREYRKCNWECVGKLEQKFAVQKKRDAPYAAFVFEPLIQGAAGMIPQPHGWLRRAAEISRAHGALLIADEVMTGFGRTNSTCDSLVRDAKLKGQSSGPGSATPRGRRGGQRASWRHCLPAAQGRAAVLLGVPRHRTGRARTAADRNPPPDPATKVRGPLRRTLGRYSSGSHSAGSHDGRSSIPGAGVVHRWSGA